MIKNILLIVLVLLVSACQTDQNSKTYNIGARQANIDSDAGFNKVKAAQNRVHNGLVYLSKNNFERAKFHLDKALTYNSSSGHVHYALGLYYQKVKEYKSSRKHFKRALRINSKDPQYLNAYGAYLCETKEYKQAAKYFNKAIDIPTYTEASSTFFNMGLCALDQSKAQDAEKYFKKALNRNSKMVGALIEMAKIEFNRNRYQRAKAYIDRFEKNGSITPESAWLGLRTAHYLQNKNDIGSYGIILELRFPDSYETTKYLDDKKRWM